MNNRNNLIKNVINCFNDNYINIIRIWDDKDNTTYITSTNVIAWLKKENNIDTLILSFDVSVKPNISANLTLQMSKFIPVKIDSIFLLDTKNKELKWNNDAIEHHEKMKAGKYISSFINNENFKRILESEKTHFFNA